jgi:hypothetical protein
MSPCGQPLPPVRVLMNNTRLNYPEPASGPITPFISSSPDACLAWCINNTQCGAIVFREPYEPLPVGFGCDGAKPTDGCCYPAPLQEIYGVVSPGGPATYGFVSAIVRYGPSNPPRGIPPAWNATYNMNASISLWVFVLLSLPFPSLISLGGFLSSSSSVPARKVLAECNGP